MIELLNKYKLLPEFIMFSDANNEWMNEITLPSPYFFGHKIQSIIESEKISSEKKFFCRIFHFVKKNY